MRSWLFPVQGLEGVDRQPVQPHAANGRETFVQRVADEDVREAKTTGTAGNIGENACGHRFVQRFEQLLR